MRRIDDGLRRFMIQEMDNELRETPEFGDQIMYFWDHMAVIWVTVQWNSKFRGRYRPRLF